MAHSGFLTIAVTAIVTIIVGALLQDATAIRCWNCASDQYNGQFCNDPFDLSIATEHQKKWSYTECKHPPGQSNPYDQPLAERAVCKKVKQIININEYHVFRMCFWENIHAPRNECVNAHTPSYIKTVFCETCDTDGCNAATQYRPVAAALVLTISVIAAKFLIF